MNPTPREVVAFSPSQEAVRKNQQPCMVDPRIRTRFTLRAVALLAGVLASADFCAWAESDVFVSGTGGYNTYRIPAIVRAPNGTLLAFCEGRPSSSDTGNIDIVLRRSTDNGATWGTMTVVRDEGTDSATNPGPVVDGTTGRIFLHYSKSITRPFYMFSDDNGATWSAPVEITATAKAAGWGYCVPGPGHSIQLKRGAQAGRLLVPSHHYLTSGAKGIHAVYSDDHGATWFYGSVATAAGGINPDECLAVELVAPAAGGGSQVYFNIRDESGSAAGNRTIGKSIDGGTTLTLPLSNDTRFVTPIVQGSVLRLRATDEGDAINVILFSCPNHASNRQNMSIWYSIDEGANWSAPRSIYTGGSAYSDMARLTDRTVGLLYEKDPNSKITFTSFGPDFLGLGATWDSTSSIGWGTASNWINDVTPTFNNQLDVYFCAPATTKFAINIGTSGVSGINRTIRSLNFNANADSNVTIELQSANVSGTLTFDTDAADGTAALIVDAGSAGSHTVGINNFGSVILADNLLATHNGSGTLTLGRAVSGTGKSLTKAGAGRLNVNGGYTAGTATVTAGTLGIGGSSEGFNPSTRQIVVNSGGTLTYNAANVVQNNVLLTVNGAYNLNSLTDVIGQLAGAGTIALGTATLTLDGFGNPSSQTFSGTISGSGGLSLRNLTGTQILSGANTYTGPTTVSLGTLLVNAPGSLASNSNVTVAANATLGGTGTVSGPVAVTGTLAPGASAGTLTTGAVTFQPGSSFALDPADWNGTTAGTHWNLLAAASLVFNNTPSNKLTIRISGPAANFTESNKTFIIATASGTITGLNPAAIAINATGFPGAGVWTVQQTGNAIQLVYHANDFTAWAAAHAPGQTIDMDHDQDGVQNGIEYFMGEAGAGFTALPVPDASRTVKWTRGGSYPGAYGTDYIVQTSTDLVTWDDVHESQLAIGATVNYTIPTGVPQRFARLKVAGP
jgi:autotransporter-associated beta strand protein